MPSIVDPGLRAYGSALKELRSGRGWTQATLAEAMGYDRSRISQVESGASPPSEEFTRLAETVLGAQGTLWRLWHPISEARGTDGRRVERELSETITEFAGWVADHSAYDYGAVDDAVLDAIAQADAQRPSVRRRRQHARQSITRTELAQRIRSFYGPTGFCRGHVGDLALDLSIASTPAWLSPVPLGGAAERVRYAPPSADTFRMGQHEVEAAVRRLAEVELNDTVIVNNPLYRLLGLEIRAGRLDLMVTTIDFAHYAMTACLLEAEMVEAPDRPVLRGLHLPDTASAMRFGERVCVGGIATLLAVARPATDGRPSDYVVFVTHRSARVVDSPGKLAVVPKAFHQPTGDHAGDVRLSTTLRRELAEELLGDVDQEGPGKRFDPGHRLGVPEPLEWLLKHTSSWRADATGFAVDMVAGNYVFPCLMVIEDETWWARFGHMVEANWETKQVRRYSTRDAGALAALASDRTWSDDGLFALLHGLRRLAETGDPARIAIPPIEMEL